MAVNQRPAGYPDTLVFYDLANQTGAPRNAIPHPNWNVWQLLWAPNSRVVYAAIYPRSSEANGEL